MAKPKANVYKTSVSIKDSFRFDAYFAYFLRMSLNQEALKDTNEILFIYRNNEMSASIIVAFNDKNEVIEVLYVGGQS